MIPLKNGAVACLHREKLFSLDQKFIWAEEFMWAEAREKRISDNLKV